MNLPCYVRFVFGIQHRKHVTGSTTSWTRLSSFRARNTPTWQRANELGCRVFVVLYQSNIYRKSSPTPAIEHWSGHHLKRVFVVLYQSNIYRKSSPIPAIEHNMSGHDLKLIFFQIGRLKWERHLAKPWSGECSRYRETFFSL
jgi:hypothetical protein